MADVDDGGVLHFCLKCWKFFVNNKPLIARVAPILTAMAVVMLGASIAEARPGTAGHGANHTATHPTHQTQATRNQTQKGTTTIPPTSGSQFHLPETSNESPVGAKKPQNSFVAHPELDAN